MREKKKISIENIDTKILKEGNAGAIWALKIYVFIPIIETKITKFEVENHLGKKFHLVDVLGNKHSDYLNIKINEKKFSKADTWIK